MGAQVVVFMVLGIFYNIPMGLGVTLNTLVGNAMGAGDVTKTKRLFRVGVAINLITVSLIDVALYFFKDNVASFYTEDSDIRSIADKVFNIYIFLLPADALQYMMGGFIRGIGKSQTGSICFFVCYYVIGLPLAFIFGNVLHHYDQGLWYGLGAAIYSIFICFIVIICTTDLNTQIKSVGDHIFAEHSKLSPVTSPINNKSVSDRIGLRDTIQESIIFSTDNAKFV